MKRKTISIFLFNSDLLKSPYASHVSLKDVNSEVFSNKGAWSPNPPKSRRPISAPVHKNDLNGSISGGKHRVNSKMLVLLA